ncbi:hypothetical protein LZ31DRAFT_636895, partial [Colletotrichum somersetense]
MVVSFLSFLFLCSRQRSVGCRRGLGLAQEATRHLTRRWSGQPNYTIKRCFSVESKGELSNRAVAIAGCRQDTGLIGRQSKHERLAWGAFRARVKQRGGERARSRNCYWKENVTSQ